MWCPAGFNTGLACQKNFGKQQKWVLVFISPGIEDAWGFCHIFLVRWKISVKSYLSVGTLSKGLLECKKILGITGNAKQKYKKRKISL